jgi:putative flippase GtrA
MQWGTPSDLEEYRGWSNVFRRLAADDAQRARQSGSVLVPMAGYGKRFADAGYDVSKPLIPVSGRPMVIQATRDLPDAPTTRFVLRRDTPLLDEIIRKLRTSFVGVSPLVLDEGTEGQAITCRLGLPGLEPEAPLTIGACDNAMLYQPSRFEAAIEEGPADVLVWVTRGHADGQRRPQMFGWVDAEPDGRVTGVRVKETPEDPRTAPMIVGAFTFRRAADFERACARLVARDGRVNGEFYADSLIQDVVALGLDCRLFEIDHYIGWGTPHDLKTFEYWQSCFHKWASHPYRLEKDRRIPPAQVPALAERYKARSPSRPASLSGPPPGPRSSGVLGELLRFMPVGVGAVGSDFLVYAGLMSAHMDATPAKALSFIAGALFAFAANRYFTFRKTSGVQGFLLFWLVYATSLALNVGINATTLAAGVSVGLADPIAIFVAFVTATGVSAAINFMGMKWLVFRGAPKLSPATK